VAPNLGPMGDVRLVKTTKSIKFFSRYQLKVLTKEGKKSSDIFFRERSVIKN
jgi:hypothetical protein